MRQLFRVVALSLAWCAFTGTRPASADENNRTETASAVALASANGGSYSRIEGRWWYRTADGQRYVHVCNQWVRVPNEGGQASIPPAAVPPAAAPREYTARRFSLTPSVITTYPHEGPGDISHGVEWYRNGRGNFSD